MHDKQFAQRLIATMKKAGFTQRTLAKSVGVSQSTVSRLLRGTLPPLAVGIHLSTILSVDHGWLIEGIEPAPEVEFTEQMLRRLIKARKLEGMELSDIAKIAALPVQTFAAVEGGNQIPNSRLLRVWMSILNVEERYILEGRGRMFKTESRFILIPPDEISVRQEELQKLKSEVDFLARRVERMEWELAESQKAHKADSYRPRIVSGVRKRMNWND